MRERKNCRKYYRELRDSMSQEMVSQKSKAICERIISSEEYQKAQILFGYYPLGKEVDCKEVLQQALTEGKQVALPRVAEGRQMDFYEIHKMEDVEEGNFHVMEPKAECKRIVLLKDTDTIKEVQILVLVPGVVFDSEGNRYGYGKGYYDRYFARFPNLMRMALAYTEQITEEPLECLGTDIKMHRVITDTRQIVVKDYAE